MKYIITVLVICTSCSIGLCQDFRHYELPVKDSMNHTSVLEGDLTFLLKETQSGGAAKRSFKQWSLDKLLHENFLFVNKPDFIFTIDPIFENHIGREFAAGENIHNNTRGIRIQGLINFEKPPNDNRTYQKETTRKVFPRLEFSSTYYEAQSNFTPYLDSIISSIKVVPSQASYQITGYGMDYSHAEGKLKYVPNKIFSLTAGHGKNFFGNGYRSLLLSDGAANYPFLRIDTKIWRIHYINMWAEFQDMNYWSVYGQPFQKKYGAFHYLSLSATKRLEFSFFEVINWQGRDSTHFRGFELNYLNPVIFLRPVEWTIGSPDNVLMGAGVSYLLGKSSYLYGQFIMDELNFYQLSRGNFGNSQNKMGLQLGVKSWIPLGNSDLVRDRSEIKNKHLFVQSEFNAVRPYTYSHITSKSNYGHFNQSLAHPLGANFYEWVNFARLRWDRVLIEGRYSFAQFGTDYNGLNYGHDIFENYTTAVSNSNVYIGQGWLNTLSYKTLTASFLVNPASNFNIFVSMIDRHQRTEQMDKHDFIVQFGVRSSVRNLYYDF